MTLADHESPVILPIFLSGFSVFSVSLRLHREEEELLRVFVQHLFEHEIRPATAPLLAAFLASKSLIAARFFPFAFSSFVV